MDYIELKARAKINFAIDVVGKREDGYHLVRMIMQSLELHDRIRIEKNECGIEIFSSSTNIPTDSSNIAYKAAVSFFDKYKCGCGVKIHIDKRIPVCAGLAGGSADAAEVIKGLNLLFDVNAAEEELCAIGVGVGADVPFCIIGGTMLAEGIGEKLTPLKPVRKLPIIIVKPSVNASTKWVYKNFSMDHAGKRPDIDEMIKAIQLGDYHTMGSSMRNVLESVTAKKYPVINEIKGKLLEFGAIGSIMSGSGSSVLAVFEDVETARNAFDCIKKDEYNCFLTEAFNG